MTKQHTGTHPHAESASRDTAPERERRIARSVFTRKLERICRELDRQPRRAVNYRHFVGRGITEAEIVRLWVYGSYARGAAKCGDLDLLIEVSYPQRGVRTYAHQVATAFFGRLARVRFCGGTPITNEMGLPFPDAKELWSGPGCDWRSRIDAIAEDPEADRMPRLTDSIPLRPEQLKGDLDELQLLAREHQDGIWAWEFVPFDRMHPPRTDTRRLQPVFNSAGHATLDLLPHLAALVKKIAPGSRWQSTTRRTDARCGAMVVQVGRPDVYAVRQELTNPATECVILAPHMSARGPNGAWIVRRGPAYR